MLAFSATGDFGDFLRDSAGNFHSTKHVSRGTESFVPNMSVALRHTNCRRGGPSHDARHDWVGDASFQQTGDRSMSEIVKSALQRVRLSLCHVAFQNCTCAFLGSFPPLFPIPDGLRWICIVDDRARCESETVCLAGSTVLLAREDEVGRLSFGKSCRPYLQYAKDSAV